MSKISASSACALAFCLLGSVVAQQPGTVYELFDDGTTNANDLTGQAFTFTPNAAGGYDITAAGSLLPASNSVIIGDDELLDAIPLGFTINVAGAGAVSTIAFGLRAACRALATRTRGWFLPPRGAGSGPSLRWSGDAVTRPRLVEVGRSMVAVPPSCCRRLLAAAWKCWVVG